MRTVPAQPFRVKQSRTPDQRGPCAVLAYNARTMPASLFPILLGVHVTLAIALVLPSIALPFVLRSRAAPASGGPGLAVRLLLALQSHGTVVIGAGLAVTGVGLILSLGVNLFSQPWLMVALSIYAANLALAFFVQRPNLRRLLVRGSGDEAVWKARARRQRYVSYAMAGLVGTIAFLMSTKPELW